MRSVFALASVLAVASAAPANVARQWQGQSGPSSGYPASEDLSGYPKKTTPGGVTYSYPTFANGNQLPLSNGFPNPSASELAKIQQAAHGTLPKGALPTKISDASALNLQLIAYNEIFEVAYFTTLLNNITSGQYTVGGQAATQIVVNALEAVQGQEQMHGLGANGILKSAGRPTIDACEYHFPVNDFDSAIAFAATFTDIVVGTLQAAQLAFAQTNDTELVPLIGGVIGQEGEQNGFYDSIVGQTPSQQPFLTNSAGRFAFAALNQLVVVPGSCVNSYNIIAAGIPALEPLTAPSSVTLKDQTLDYSFMTNTTTQASDWNGYYLAYVNGQNPAVVVALENLQVSGKTVKFQASFPAETDLFYGLTLGAVVKGNTSYPNANAVATNAVYGPAVFVIGGNA